MLRFEGNNGRICEFDRSSVKVSEALAGLGQEKKALAGKLNGELLDLEREVSTGGTLEPVLSGSEEGLSILRHSCAHLMAQAIENLYPGTHFGIGPCIKDGFYYDVDVAGAVITEQDLPAIEAEMRRLAGAAERVERVEMGRDEALRFFGDRSDPYKVELITDLDVPGVSLYRQGNYVDLCRGPHVPDTSWLRHFKLLSVAGAYWRDRKSTRLNSSHLR